MKYSLHKSILKNGTRILFIHTPKSKSFIFNTSCNAGYNYADTDKYELPHLLEHLAFGATRNYPVKGQLEYQIEKIGGWSNAYTDEKTVRYSMAGSSINYGKIADMALEQYTKITFNAQNLESEKQVVQLELERDIDDEDDIVRRLTYARLFPEKLTSPKDKIKTLANISIKDIEDFYKLTHTQANSTFIIAGNLPPIRRAKLVRKISKQLTDIPIGKKPQSQPAISTKEFQSTQSQAGYSTDQMYYNIAFIRQNSQRGIEYDAACCVTEAVFNRGAGSRLFRKAREAGLAYSIDSGIDNERKYGELYIIDQTSTAMAPKLLELCLDELINIKGGDFSDDELERAIEYRAGEYDTEYETPSNLADWYGPMFIEEKPLYSPGEFAKAVRNVTNKDVSKILDSFVKEDNWLISLVGHDAKRYESGFAKTTKLKLSKIHG